MERYWTAVTQLRQGALRLPPGGTIRDVADGR